MDQDSEKRKLSAEQKLFQKYPYHIYIMVMAAVKALKEGKIKIEDGMLIPTEEKPSEPKTPESDKK
ncbi:MAG: hypothetical protein LHV69_09285 [Elusimicrobia bacterium]|nr:hypothetical protein [Candidatus Obscuribacterium magneticum]